MSAKISEIVETFKSEPWKYCACIAGTVTAGILGVKIWKALQNKHKEPIPEGVVVLHQQGRGPWAPSLVPFAVKLESYLRFANIKYMHSDEKRRSSKNKLPWIEYNGKEYADSEFIIEFLNKEFNVDLNSHLTPEQKGIGRAVQKMVEENLYWCMVIDRWIFDPTKGGYKALKVSSWLRFFLKPLIKRQLYAQGMGRHSEPEVDHIMELDMEAISNILGNKKYLFGDKITQYDLAVFGMLCQFRYQSFGGYGTKCIQDYSNLCTYCESIKAAIWPDWDQCNTAGGTRKALK